MKPNRSIMVLGAIVIGVIIGAVFLRGEKPAPDNPDLPAIAIETQ